MDVGTLSTELIIPRNATLMEIRESYGPLLDEIRCGLEGCRTPHKRGFVVSFINPAGEVMGVGNVGHMCGKKAFGTKWIEAERAYDAKVRVAEMDAARARFLLRAGQILPELTAALPRLRMLDTARRAIEKNAPQVMRACSDAVKSYYGRIKIYSNGDDKTLHRLKGEPFWTDSGSSLFRAQTLNAEASRFMDYLSDPEATNKEVERRLESLADIEHRWNLVSRAMDAAEAALRPSHLEKVFLAVDLIVRQTPHQLGYERHDEWQLYVRMRGTVLEVRKWDGLSGLTRDKWDSVVDLG